MRVRRLKAVLASAVGLVLLGIGSPVWADDADGDGVDDAIDVCNNTPAGTAVDAEGRPLGDIDQNCDTDLDDFALFHKGVIALDGYALFQQGFTGPLAPAGVVIDTVPIGNPGNPGELSGEGAGGYGPDRICGAVDYVYNMATYEVTAGQYCKFLNAVAASDRYGLYSRSMDSLSFGCQITRNGTDGNYTYDFSGRPSGTETDWVNRPVNYVSWGDAARFANWLHNGQPKGDQDLTTTEDGSYYLNGATGDAELMAVVRKVNATWVIPSEDEWYKAAYHYNNGVTGNYYDYPTSSDSVPSNDLVDPDPGNNATFDDNGYTIGPPYYRTEFGSHENSNSPYDTLDQGGNVEEWNEAIIYGSFRGLRGGSFNNNDSFLRASRRNVIDFPTDEINRFGFRVAEVP